MVNGFMLRRNARGFAFADRGEDRGAGHPAVIAVCQAQARRLAQRGLLASLLCGAALLMGSDGALAAACTFPPLTLAQNATCDGLTVNNGQNGTVDNSGAITTTGEVSAVDNSGTITQLNNSGSISAPGWYGVYNHTSGVIGILTNSGTITGTENSGAPTAGVYNEGTISNLTNNAGAKIFAYEGVINSATGTITTLTNDGEISGSLTQPNVQAIRNYGTIGSLTNRGTITSGYKGVANENTLTLLDNFGSILSVDGAVQNNDSLPTLINEQSGTISGSFGFYNNGTVDTLTNYGTIRGKTWVGIVQDNQAGKDPSTIIIKKLYNYGTITGVADGIDNYVNLGDVYNYSNATISGGDEGLYNAGKIANIFNDGSISGSNANTNWSGPSYVGYGVYNEPNASITSITNKGSITGYNFSIYNGGSIGTLTNGQGGNGASAETKALTYKGALPSSYFIYVSSATHYGQTFFTTPSGQMTFGIDSGSTLENGSYKSILTGLTTTAFKGGLSGTFNGTTWTLALHDGSTDIWDLLVTGKSVSLPTPSADNTRTALAANATALRNTLNARTTIIAGTMDYDCATFDAYGLCLSFQARYTAMDSVKDGAGVLIAAYRLAPNLRLGGFIDYSVSRQDPAGLKFGDAQPIFGAFLGYGEPLGLQAKISAAVNTGHVTVTRSNSLPDTEPGSGKASLNTYAIAGELGWAVALGGSTVATPYGGLRVTNASRGAYGESKVVDVVDFPISYATYSQRLTTATAGLRLMGQLSDQVGYQLGLGGEYDLAHNANNYTGTSAIPGLLSFDLPNDGTSNRFRAIGSADLFYQIDRTQRLTANVSLRGQAYSSQAAVSVMAGYQTAF